MDSNTELAAELKAAIDYTAEQCANAPYVPVKAETAQAILNALTQPAEQIADGALGAERLADLHYAFSLHDAEKQWDTAEILMHIGNTIYMSIRQKASSHEEAVRLTHEAIQSSEHPVGTHAQQARAQALEEAAKVAEGGFKNRTTRIRIATAIRALNGQGGGV